jgi:hypothetical protein
MSHAHLVSFDRLPDGGLKVIVALEIMPEELKTEAESKPMPEELKTEAESKPHWRDTPNPADDAVIESVLPNPKRGQSAIRYGYYSVGMSVGSYRETIRREKPPGWQMCNQDLRWDLAHGFIRLTAA